MNEKEIYEYLKNKYEGGSSHEVYGIGSRDLKDDEKEGFEHEEAKKIVKHMYHSEGSKVLKGEYFSMNDAKEVKERYRGIIPHGVSECDIYVAINAQYHDFINLFRSWFHSGTDHKIVESALIFWFQDEDKPGIQKLKEYFEK